MKNLSPIYFCKKLSIQLSISLRSLKGAVGSNITIPSGLLFNFPNKCKTASSDLALSPEIFWSLNWIVHISHQSSEFLMNQNLNILLEIFFASFACIIVQATNGLPKKFLIFLPGIPFDGHLSLK